MLPDSARPPHPRSLRQAPRTRVPTSDRSPSNATARRAGHPARPPDPARSARRASVPWVDTTVCTVHLACGQPPASTKCPPCGGQCSGGAIACYNSPASALTSPVPGPAAAATVRGAPRTAFGHCFMTNIPYPGCCVKWSDRCNMQRFGEKLRTLRTRRGMTVRELAVALGYAASSHSYISEAETGKRVPKTQFVLKVAQFFSVTTDQLLRDDIELDAEAGSAQGANDRSSMQS